MLCNANAVKNDPISSSSHLDIGDDVGHPEWAPCDSNAAEPVLGQIAVKTPFFGAPLSTVTVRSRVLRGDLQGPANPGESGEKIMRLGLR
jgi:hypothetical protein